MIVCLMNTKKWCTLINGYIIFKFNSFFIKNKLTEWKKFAILISVTITIII